MVATFLRYNAYRLGLALAALAWAVWSAIAEGIAPLPVFRAVALALSLVLVVVFAARGRNVSKPFQLVQLAVDTALVSMLSAMTGGLYSFATLFYFPAIGAGAYLLRREGALWTATFASISFVVMAWWNVEFTRPWSDRTLVLWSEAMFRVFAFYLMAILTGQLGEMLARSDRALKVQQDSRQALASEHDSVLNRVRAGILSTDRDQRVVSVNPAGQQLFGDVRGQPLALVLPRALEAEVWEEARADGKRWVCSRASLPDGGSVVVVEDVTEMVRMRETALRNERLVAVGRMAASMAHEVRNPLASLSGSLQLIREETPSRLADLALAEADRLNRLVEDFLNVARGPTITPRPTDVLSVAQEVCDAFTRDPRYAHLVTTRCEGGPAMAMTDADRLRQALWNLVLNGAQAMPRGGSITLRVLQTAASPTRLDGVELVVEDEGPGIPETERQRIFDPFYTTRVGGTGLGLLLVDQIVRGHNGTVRAERGLNGGTAFHLWLPRDVPLAS